MNIIEVTRQSPWQEIADVTTLLIEQMKERHGDFDEKNVKLAMENALKPGTSARFFLCYGSDGTAAGCIMINIGSGIEAGGDYIWINELCVRSGRRGRGTGAALVGHLLHWAREEGYGYLAGVTALSNDAARRLLDRCGFAQSEMTWVDKRL